ncbi:hypothetical protein D3C83_62060 [compost metagenome]
MIEVDVLTQQVEVGAHEIPVLRHEGDLGLPVVGRRDRRERIGLQGLPALDLRGKAVNPGASPVATAGERALTWQQHLRGEGDPGRKIGEIGIV